MKGKYKSNIKCGLCEKHVSTGFCKTKFKRFIRERYLILKHTIKEVFTKARKLNKRWKVNLEVIK